MSEKNRKPFSANLGWLFLPVVATVAVLLFSPNFQPSPPDRERSTPFGSDYLQEYVGGRIFFSDDRERLYDLEHVRALQHDSELVGFIWPEDDYFPMVYPPFYYAAHGVLSGFNYQAASRIWLGLMGLALVLTGWQLFRFFPPIQKRFPLAVLLAVFFSPVLLSLNMAQKGTLLLLVLTTTFLLLYHRRSLLAGLMFGLICFKPHLGVTIGLIMLIKRDWKFCIGALTTVATIVGLSLAVSPTLWSDYMKVILGMGNYVQSGGYDLADSHSLWASAQLTLGFLSTTSVKIIAALFGLAVLASLARTSFRKTDYQSPTFGLEFSLMVTTTILLSPHFYTYDLTIFLLPLLLIAVTLEPTKRSQLDWSLMALLAGFFVLSGLFRQVAGSTGIHLSVVMLLAIFMLASMKRKRLSAK